MRCYYSLQINNGNLILHKLIFIYFRLCGIGLTQLLEWGWPICWNRVDWHWGGLCWNRVDFVGIGLTLLESGWLCWNRVDQKSKLIFSKSTQFQQKRVIFVGIGLTQEDLFCIIFSWNFRHFFQVNPIPTKKGHICWNWVDSRKAYFLDISWIIQVEIFWVNPIPTDKGHICWNWVDSSRPIFWTYHGKFKLKFLESTQFQQKRVIIVGIGLTFFF